MKLVRLYSNQPTVFSPIVFTGGMSVVLAEIRLLENKGLDTHNLGKTTVGELIDYCLLKKKSNSFFLWRYESLFAQFAFYLEVMLDDGSYLTIGRPVTPGSRIDFKRSEKSVIDATQLGVDDWDHLGVASDRARLMLDGYLGIDVLKPWDYRKLVGYLIRSQADYLDVFQLGKFSGKHQDWKPFVGHLLGLEAEPAQALYDKREELSDTKASLGVVMREWGDDSADPSVLDALIAVKRRDVAERERTIDSFNFHDDDRRVNAELSDEIDRSILGANEERYAVSQKLARLESSLEDEKVLFRPSDAEKLFAEAGVSLGEQVTKSYEQLIRFNREITQERTDALRAQAQEARDSLENIEKRLKQLQDRRAEALSYLRESAAVAKFKEVSKEATRLRSELLNLEDRRRSAQRVTDLRRDVRRLDEEYGRLETVVESEIEAMSVDDESRFGRLRGYFNDIVFAVLGQNAILAISLNASGGIEFTAEFVGESGSATAGDKGTSYRKLLCIAFDLAVLRAYLDVPFPRFAYHDGALEQLEPRKRENLLTVIREYADLGLQPIISVLDSDLPDALGSGNEGIVDADVIVHLHDEGSAGRLFKMDAW